MTSICWTYSMWTERRASNACKACSSTNSPRKSAKSTLAIVGPSRFWWRRRRENIKSPPTSRARNTSFARNSLVTRTLFWNKSTIWRTKMYRTKSVLSASTKWTIGSSVWRRFLRWSWLRPWFSDSYLIGVTSSKEENKELLKNKLIS